MGRVALDSQNTQPIFKSQSMNHCGTAGRWAQCGREGRGRSDRTVELPPAEREQCPWWSVADSGEWLPGDGWGEGKKGGCFEPPGDLSYNFRAELMEVPGTSTEMDSEMGTKLTKE